MIIYLILFFLIGGVFGAALVFLKNNQVVLKLKNDLFIAEQSLELHKKEQDLLTSFSSDLKISSYELLSDFYEKTENNLKLKVETLDQIISPLKNHLNQFQQDIKNFETKRAEEQGSLKEQISQLLLAEKKLEKETSSLTQILKSPISRGRWGEIQLKRILELSGMLKYCDFSEQKKLQDSLKKPDVLIHLPDNKYIIIDAKFPISESYFNVENKTEQIHLQDLISKIREHIKILKQKSYWEDIKDSPEFVVLFLPGESLFNDALKLDPELIEFSSDANIFLTSPITLLAMLKTIAYAWKQENIKGQLEAIGLWGRTLYSRISHMVSHLSKVGKNLSNAVNAYNDTIGNIEKRVLVTARKFEKFDSIAENKKITHLNSIEEKIHFSHNLNNSQHECYDAESSNLSEL